MLRECAECKDRYYGDSWGIPVDDKIVCFYCYYGMTERKWTSEWV